MPMYRSMTIILLLACVCPSLTFSQVSDSDLTITVYNQHISLNECSRVVIRQRVFDDNLDKSYWEFIIKYLPTEWTQVEAARRIEFDHFMVVKTIDTILSNDIINNADSLMKHPDLMSRTYDNDSQQKYLLVGYRLDDEFIGYGLYHIHTHGYGCSGTDFLMDASLYVDIPVKDGMLDGNFLYFRNLRDEPHTRLMLVKDDVLIDTQTGQSYPYALNE